MGLESFKSDPDENDDRSPNQCPECEKEGKYLIHVQYKCLNSDCDVISWYNNGSMKG